jgi:GT2 family glycosyltransferase
VNDRSGSSDRLAVDIVIPCYNESADAIERTIRAVRAQTRSPRRVVLVDDCSVDQSGLAIAPTLGAEVLRQPRNGGISAARNAGMRDCDAPFVACVNIEVLPRPDWIAVCTDYLLAHPRVGVVAIKVSPEDLEPLLVRWRVRFQEAHYPKVTGPIPWGTGHALMFRTEALKAVGGFDERLRLAAEDVDVCFRVQGAGWEVHFVAETSAISIQHNTLRALARAEYNRSIYRADRGNGFWRGLGIAANRMFQRSIRHVIFFRWPLLLVEPGVFYHQWRSIWRHR